jgi:hypothetical protein
VTSLVTLTALNFLGRTGFGALFRVIALLLAVLVGIRVIALLRTVARMIAGLLAVNALDGRLSRLMLNSILGTALEKLLVPLFQVHVYLDKTDLATVSVIIVAAYSSSTLEDLFVLRSEL